MLGRISDALVWLPDYYRRRRGFKPSGSPADVYFCICDHYEPYWNRADGSTARKRIQRWLDGYPPVADRHRDSDGRVLKYGFFYPEEEYRFEDIKQLETLCRAGYGEFEIHLHHDNDTPDNLKRTLLDFKNRLHHDHGLLSVDGRSGEIVYGFIHGNWALDNSRPDGRWCGINNEINILMETGCYADFTMPSAPDNTQTHTVNRIYYAVDDPGLPKSHDTGIEAAAGRPGEGLLMIQGPLAPNWKRRIHGLIPKIENGGLMGNNPPTRERIDLWIGQHIHVTGAPDHVFVKIYTHGTQEPNMDMLFDRGYLDSMLEYLAEWPERHPGSRMHFVSAREMANIVLAIEAGVSTDIASSRDYRYQIKGA